jgi:hypothetical protein
VVLYIYKYFVDETPAIGLIYEGAVGQVGKIDDISL